MSDQNETTEKLDRLLREGLGSLAAPAASPTFDRAVLTALKRPEPWWRRLRPPARLVRALARVPAVSLGICVVALAGLMVHPATRWIVAEQFGLGLHRHSGLQGVSADRGDDRERSSGFDPVGWPALAVVAEQYANDDFQMRVAGAVAQFYFENPIDPFSSDEASTTTPADNLRKLKRQFGDRPSLYANIVRFDSDRIRFQRGNRSQVIFGAGGFAIAAQSQFAPQAYVRQYLEDCQAGERLEPGNAYFPLMRSYGLFAAGRDEAALAAIRRAAGLTQWNAHFRDEFEGMWKLERLRGFRSASIRNAVLANIALIDNGRLWQVADLAVERAEGLELSGRTAEAFRIRRDVSRCGALIRHAGQTTWTNTIGLEMVRYAGRRPRGERLERRQHGDGNDQEAWNRAAAHYIKYLRTIGEEREAIWYANEIGLSSALQNRNSVLFERTPAGSLEMKAHQIAWVLSTGLLGNALWLFLLGAGGWLYLRRHKERQVIGENREPASVVLVVATSLILAMLLFAFNQGRGVYGFLVKSGVLGTSLSEWENPQEAIGFVGIFMGLAVALPHFVLYGAMVVSAVRRRPVLRDTARAMRSVGLACAGGLFLTYAAMTIRTAVREAEIHAALSESIEHQGRYVYRFSGLPWPPLDHD